jgi:hypothetical protein
MASSARASLANVSERAILPLSIVASIQNPCRASLGYCSAMAMQERVAREDRPLQVVLCTSELGVRDMPACLGSGHARAARFATTAVSLPPGERGSGQPWWAVGRAAPVGDRRFTERFFAWTPYLYGELGGAEVEWEERALIEAGTIRAIGFRYVGEA